MCRFVISRDQRHVGLPSRWRLAVPAVWMNRWAFDWCETLNERQSSCGESVFHCWNLIMNLLSLSDRIYCCTRGWEGWLEFGEASRSSATDVPPFCKLLLFNSWLLAAHAKSGIWIPKFAMSKFVWMSCYIWQPTVQCNSALYIYPQRFRTFYCFLDCDFTMRHLSYLYFVSRVNYHFVEYCCILELFWADTTLGDSITRFLDIQLLVLWIWDASGHSLAKGQRFSTSCLHLLPSQICAIPYIGI